MLKNSWCVYKHTNKVNGKSYIGITSQDVRVRWNRGWGYQYCPHFWRAIQKYGWDNFTHEILYDGLTKREAEVLEVNLIKDYRSADCRFGYNVSLGGNGVGKHSAETRKKIGDRRRGFHHAEESKRKMSESHKGKTLSEEHIAKLKTAQFGSKHHRARAVYQLSLSGEIIEYFECIADAERKTGVTNKNICKCCKKERRHAGGYVWRYAEEVSLC